MKKAIFPEYLGKIHSEALLQNLLEMNPTATVVTDKIRLAFSGGFEVTGEFEMPVYETAAEKEQFLADLQSRLRRRESGADILGVLYPPGKKLIRLILEPIRPSEG